MFHPDDEWESIRCVEKDVCYLYHHLSHYSTLNGDLDYASDFNLPYWRFLLLENTYPDIAFMKEGCMLMVATMAVDCINERDSFILKHIEDIKYALKNLYPENERERDLLDAVNFLMSNLPRQTAEKKEIEEKALWIHNAIVRGYYKRKAYDFDKDPYFKL